MQDQMRWVVAQKNRVRNGELYRFIADSRGAFVQVRKGSRWCLCQQRRMCDSPAVIRMGHCVVCCLHQELYVVGRPSCL